MAAGENHRFCEFYYWWIKLKFKNVKSEAKLEKIFIQWPWQQPHIWRGSVGGHSRHIRGSSEGRADDSQDCGRCVQHHYWGSPGARLLLGQNHWSVSSSFVCSALFIVSPFVFFSAWQIICTKLYCNDLFLCCRCSLTEISNGSSCLYVPWVHFALLFFFADGLDLLFFILKKCKLFGSIYWLSTLVSFTFIILFFVVAVLFCFA